MPFNTPQKQQYRMDFWAAVAKYGRLRANIATCNRKVVILDTHNAHETKHLLSIGYRPENITVVNKAGPQSVSYVNRAIRPLRVRAKGGDLLEVLDQLDEKFDVINFDSCGPFIPKRDKPYLRGLAEHLGSHGLLGYTFLRGHDSVRDLNGAFRVHQVMHTFYRRGISLVTWNNYVNPIGKGRSPMTWMLLRKS